MRATRRWQRLVESRLAEMERLSPGRGAVGAAFWDAPARARQYAAGTAGSAERHPLLARVRRAAGAKGTVLDVGAGTGRFALALAPSVSQVVAVDASRAMLAVLGRHARQRGITNVRCVLGRWEEVAHGAGADVAMCSYVLPLVADAGAFLRKLDAAATGRVFVSLAAVSSDLLLDPLWRHFHGRPRSPSPTYLDALDVLEELGICAEVEVVEVPARARYDSLGAAVRAHRDQLLLPDTPAVRRTLRRHLGSWLVERDGRLRPPLATAASAIISWRPGPVN